MPLSTPHRSLNARQDLGDSLRKDRVCFSSASLNGLQTTLNQDCYACRSPYFFAVADGVGGGALGEVASAILVLRLGELQAPHPDAVAQALKDADQDISQRMEQEGQGPGATVGAAVWLIDAKTSTWLAMTVGDCKVMVAARSGLTWRIRWESPNQSYAHCGLTPPLGVSADSPANMVGCGMPLPPLIRPITLAQGERIILCSDGFYTAFNDVQLQDILSQTPQPLSTSSAQIWCEQAQHQGALDDMTVVLVEQVIAPTVASSRWWALALIFVTAMAMGMALAWFW